MSGSEYDKSAEPAAATAGGDPWIGRVIDGRYVILERLGEGGMGAVFAAEHRQLKKPVALKIVLSEFAGNHEFAARFAREAMASAHIEHPNVCSTLDYGALPEGGAYLVMQLVRGPNLREHLREKGALPWREACEIIAQIADAIVSAHAVGIIHRDLKPENVVLMHNEFGPPTAKVLDFGIAHVKAHSQAPSVLDTGITRAGMIIGTPGYMPPEQATGQAIDETADLYALGVMLWELVVGQQPFSGETFSEIVMQQMRDPLPRLSLPPDPTLPSTLEGLLHELLAKTPGERKTSAIKVRDTLRSLTTTNSGVNTPSVTTVPPARGAVSSSPRSISDTFASNARALSPRTGMVLVFVVALAFLGLIAWRAPEQAPVAKPAAPVKAQPQSNISRAAPVVPTTPPPQPSPAPVEPRAEPAAEPPAEIDEAAQTESDSSEKKSRTRRRGHRRSGRARPVQRIKRALDNLFD